METCTQSCVPWYEPSNFAIFARPVKARPPRIASIVASVPEFAKRSRSHDGTRRESASARRTSASEGPGNESPRSAASRTAATTAGGA
jgi:hypothetical protein